MTGFGENPSTDWTRVLLNIKFNGLNLNNLQELKKNLVSDKNNNNTVFHSIRGNGKIIQVVGFLLPRPEKLQPLSICFLKLLFCLAAYPHFGHLKGFWSVWIMKWSLTFAARLNILEQTGHAHFPTSSLIGNICKTVIWSDEQYCVLLENPSTNKKNNH